jgi:hypothetical protein
VPVVLVIVAAVIIIGVSAVAIGLGGEMAHFPADVRPLDAEIETAADAALLRPSPALWGYDKQSTDAALNAVAQTVTDGDVETASLRQQRYDMRTQAGGTAGPPGEPAAPGGAQASPQPGAPSTGRWSAWERPVPPQPEDPGGAQRREDSAE